MQQPPQASQAFDDTEAVFVDSPQQLLQMLDELKQAAEIASLQDPARLFEQQPPQACQPFDDTEAVFVDSPQLLLQMLDELKRAPEIAVDLEHHDQRSYVGFVCLMQISTRSRDWIVDTLKLRGELQILNQVFADPNIIKVRPAPSLAPGALLC